VKRRSKDGLLGVLGIQRRSPGRLPHRLLHRFLTIQASPDSPKSDAAERATVSTLRHVTEILEDAITSTAENLFHVPHRF
jgi:hypothetical protein